MMRALAIAALLLTGCFVPADNDGPGPGGGPPVFIDPLRGTQWGMPVEGVECVVVFTFGQANEYSYLFGCTLGSGQTATSAEVGVYSIDADRIYMTAQESSCPREQVTIRFTPEYSLNGNTLSLIGSTVVNTFQRITPTGGSGTVLIGCFDDDLYFTQRPITPL